MLNDGKPADVHDGFGLQRAASRREAAFAQQNE